MINCLCSLGLSCGKIFYSAAVAETELILRTIWKYNSSNRVSHDNSLCIEVQVVLCTFVFVVSIVLLSGSLGQVAFYCYQ